MLFNTRIRQFPQVAHALFYYSIYIFINLLFHVQNRYHGTPSCWRRSLLFQLRSHNGRLSDIRLGGGLCQVGSRYANRLWTSNYTWSARVCKKYISKVNRPYCHSPICHIITLEKYAQLGGGVQLRFHVWLTSYVSFQIGTRRGLLALGTVFGVYLDVWYVSECSSPRKATWTVKNQWWTFHPSSGRPLSSWLNSCVSWQDLWFLLNLMPPWFFHHLSIFRPSTIVKRNVPLGRVSLLNRVLAHTVWGKRSYQSTTKDLCQTYYQKTKCT